MFRAVFFPRRSDDVSYKTQDLLHDAVVSALVGKGIAPERLLGEHAAPWTFGATHWRQPRGADGLRICHLKALEVSTADPAVGAALREIRPEDLTYARAASGEAFALAGGSRKDKTLDLAPGTQQLGVRWISPLVMTEDRAGKPWFLTNALDIERRANDLNLALSRKAGRDIHLTWFADRLAARTNPKGTHATIKVVKGVGHEVVGTVVPFVLGGPAEDLRFAWYAGVGQKTRMGFGCWDLFNAEAV